jgi:hypothetical protein
MSGLVQFAESMPNLFAGPTETALLKHMGARVAAANRLIDSPPTDKRSIRALMGIFDEFPRDDDKQMLGSYVSLVHGIQRIIANIGAPAIPILVEELKKEGGGRTYKASCIIDTLSLMRHADAHQAVPAIVSRIEKLSEPQLDEVLLVERLRMSPHQKERVVRKLIAFFGTPFKGTDFFDSYPDQSSARLQALDVLKRWDIRSQELIATLIRVYLDYRDNHVSLDLLRVLQQAAAGDLERIGAPALPLLKASKAKDMQLWRRTQEQTVWYFDTFVKTKLTELIHRITLVSQTSPIGIAKSSRAPSRSL